MAVTLLEAPVGNDVVSVIHAGVLIPIEGAHQNEMIAPAVTE